MTYNSLIKKVIGEYDSSDFISKVSGNIEKIIVQYNETDWEFLKRMASHFNTGLVVEAKSQTPKFWFGVPEGKEITEQYNYNIGMVNKTKNYTYYVIETDDLFEIGDKIRFKNLELIVYNVENTINNGILKNKYTLLTSEGLKQLFIKNEKITGNSLEGKIIDIHEDKVKVHLDIDKEQKKEEAFWFPYSTYYTTEGQTGGYCTPELDDRVQVYFPDNEEEKALIVKAVRRKTSSGDKISDPDTKYFRTKYGKEKKFTKKDLSISATDDKLILKLHEDNGIEILSNESIKITSSVDIIVKAENIDIEAKEEMFLNCEESSITMDSTTHFYGKYVKVRC